MESVEWLCTQCVVPAPQRWNMLLAPGGLPSLSALSTSANSSPTPPPCRGREEDWQQGKGERGEEKEYYEEMFSLFAYSVEVKVTNSVYMCVLGINVHTQTFSPVLTPLPQSALSAAWMAHPSHTESLQAAVVRLLSRTLLSWHWCSRVACGQAVRIQLLAELLELLLVHLPLSLQSRALLLFMLSLQRLEDCLHGVW